MILSKENLKNVGTSTVIVPEVSVFNLPEKVLQFGTGVLLRGLPDYFIDKANRKGYFNGRVVVVKSTAGATTEFDAQDNLYTLCIRGIEHGEIVEENVISSAISRVISAEQDWEAILEVARNPELQVIVSNTTEVGIVLVRESIEQNPPVSFPAKLLAVLLERYNTFNGSAEAGVVVIATELIPDNGKKLEAIVMELADHNELEQSFKDWLVGCVSFCNSLVDRIVPGKPDQKTLEGLESQLGYQDHLLSMVEPYRLWAIEGDDNVASKLEFRLADAGVIVAKDIERFRELKVRLLNGTHTLSCGIAVLAGIDTVKNGMKEELLKNYITELMQNEIAPAIPYEIALEESLAFSRVVLDRFANPYIEHLWKSITLQYSMKLKIRILPVLANYYALNAQVPPHIAFGFAAFLQYMKSAVNDDQAAYFTGQLEALSEKAYAEGVLRDTAFWGTDLSQLPGFVAAVCNYYDLITENGIRVALSAFKNLTLSSL
jgi:tagaturonate reductase